MLYNQPCSLSDLQGLVLLVVITLVVAHHLGIELFSISIFGILFTPR